MDRLVEFLVTLLVAFTLGIAWENRPPVHEVLPWWTGHMVVGLPDSRAVKAETARDAALEDLKRARIAEGVAEGKRRICADQLQAQTTANIAQAEAGRAALAVAKADVLMAQAHAATARRQAATANAYKTAPQADSCQDLLAADAVVRQAFK